MKSINFFTSIILRELRQCFLEFYIFKRYTVKLRQLQVLSFLVTDIDFQTSNVMITLDCRRLSQKILQ